MKVALLVPGFSAHERDWCLPALLDFARELSRDLSLHIFTLRFPYRRGDYRVFDARVHSLDGGDRGGAFSLRLWARALAVIAAEHRRAPFDVIHAFWANEPGWVGRLASRLLGPPLVVSLAGGELVGLRGIGYGLQLQAEQRWMIGVTLRGASRVTAGSRFMSALAEGFLSTRKDTKGHEGNHLCSLVPLGVDTRRFSPAIRPDGDSLLAVGALHPVKGHADLLRALALVVEARPGARLKIVGEGPLDGALRALAVELGVAECVEFCGALPHDGLAAHYQAAALFVQSSLHEAQGMAVLEAAACGAPVVGTAVGVLPELAEAGAGDTVRAGVPGALAGAILSALADADARRRMGERARAVVEEQFAWEVVREQWKEIYRRVKA